MVRRQWWISGFNEIYTVGADCRNYYKCRDMASLEHEILINRFVAEGIEEGKIMPGMFAYVEGMRHF